MCVVSAIVDNFRDNIWQLPSQLPAPSVIPSYPGPLSGYLSVDPDAPKIVLLSPSKLAILEKFLDTVDVAKELDTAADQKDCEDPKKTAFLSDIISSLEFTQRNLSVVQNDVTTLASYIDSLKERIYLFLDAQVSKTN